MRIAYATETEKPMSTPLGHHVVVTLGLAVFAVACAHETDPNAAVATTAAVVSNRTAVLQVAKARCRRLAECNRLGAGQTFADEPQCLEAYRDKGADLKILRACAGGVDRAPLDKCLAVLADQHCDADLGPVTAMPDCDKYCSHVDVVILE
jgi:hypothetical protein